MAVDAVKYAALIGASNVVHGPIKKVVPNPHLATLASSSIAAFALGTIPNYNPVPAIISWRPAYTTPRSSIYSDSLIKAAERAAVSHVSKTAALACKTAQGALFSTVYNLMAKRLYVDDKTLPWQLAMIAGASGGMLGSIAVVTLKFPMEMYLHLSPNLVKHPHASPALYLRTFTQMPFSDLWFLFKHKQVMAMSMAALTGATYEGIKKVVPILPALAEMHAKEAAKEQPLFLLNTALGID